MIDITNTTGITAPPIGTAFRCSILASANLREISNITGVSTDTSIRLNGAWTVLPGPVVTQVIAGNPYNDLFYDEGDYVDLLFDQNTTDGLQSRFYTSIEVNTFLQPTFNMGSWYYAVWVTPSILRFIVGSASGNNVNISQAFSQSLFNITNEAGITSAVATSLNASGPVPVINWGDWVATNIVPTPYVQSVTAFNPNNITTNTTSRDGTYILILFNTDILWGVKRAFWSQYWFDQFMQPTASLGAAYETRWVDNRTLRINITNSTGMTADTQTQLFNISSAAGIRVLSNNSAYLTGLTPKTGGSFYFVARKFTVPISFFCHFLNCRLILSMRFLIVAAPQITSVRCEDGGNDRVLGVGDRIIIDWDKPVSVAPGSTVNHSMIFTAVNPSAGASLGSRLSGMFNNSTRLTITVVNATGANPFLQCSQVTFRVSASVNIRDQFERSAPSTSVTTANMTSGAFGISDADGNAN